MDRQILKAKLYVPRYRADAVPRSRLHERLDEGARRDLTVVSAPAGFGKTTLLADWSQRSELPVAWVSLDERDDDPVRFLLYLIAAIGTIHEDFGKTTRAFLGSLQSREELEPVLTALSNEILELPSDFVLVLDDYHCRTLGDHPRRPRLSAGPLAAADAPDHRRPHEPSAAAPEAARAGTVDRAWRSGPALHTRRGDGFPRTYDGPEPHRKEGRSAGRRDGRLDRRPPVGGARPQGPRSGVPLYGSYRWGRTLRLRLPGRGGPLPPTGGRSGVLAKDLHRRDPERSPVRGAHGHDRRAGDARMAGEE